MSPAYVSTLVQFKSCIFTNIADNNYSTVFLNNDIIKKWINITFNLVTSSVEKCN